MFIEFEFLGHQKVFSISAVAYRRLDLRPLYPESGHKLRAFYRQQLGWEADVQVSCYALDMQANSDAQISIREAKPDDMDALAKVWHDSASNMDGAALEMPSVKQLRERVDHELASGWKLHIAECKDSIVGLLATKPEEEVLDQIFVLTSEQGNGIGLRLIEVAKRIMSNGFTLRMAANNLRATDFYESSGLRLVGEGTHPVSSAPVKYYGWSAS